MNNPNCSPTTRPWGTVPNSGQRAEGFEGDANADRPRSSVHCFAGCAAARRARRRALACLEGRLDHRHAGPDYSVSGGTPSSFYVPGHAVEHPYVPLTSRKLGFTDYSVGRTLGVGRELGLDNMQVTLGVRMSEPLATNGFTPASIRAAISASDRAWAWRATKRCIYRGLSNGRSVLPGTLRRSHVRHRRWRRQLGCCRISPTAVGPQCRWVARPVNWFDSASK